MNPQRLHRGANQARGRGQLREGLRYVRSTPEGFVPLVMMAIVGTLAYEFQVVLPLLARFPFHGDAGTYRGDQGARGLGELVAAALRAVGALPCPPPPPPRGCGSSAPRDSTSEEGV